MKTMTLTQSNSHALYGGVVDKAIKIILYQDVLDTCSIQNGMTLCSSARVVGLPCPG